MFPPPTSPKRLNLHGSGFCRCAVTKAGPSPLLRFLNLSALDRIAMHVAKFLDSFRVCPHVEVIIGGSGTRFLWAVN